MTNYRASALPVTFSEPRDVAEAINVHYARRAALRLAENEHTPRRGVLRGSAAGYELRRRAYPYHHTAPQVQEPYDPRAMRTFETGDHRHYALRRALREAIPGLPPGRFDDVTPVAPGEAELELERIINTPSGGTWRLVGHVDGLLAFPDGRVFVLELKTQSAMRFDDFSQDDYGPDSALGAAYAGQDAAYLWISQADGVIHVHENKDTQRIKPRVYPRSAYAARLERVENEAIAVAAAVDAEIDPLLLPACAGDDYGIKPDAKQTLRWGCSYCQFWRACHPEHVKLVSGKKLVTVHASTVARDARIAGHGLAVAPSPSWQMIEV